SAYDARQKAEHGATPGVSQISEIIARNRQNLSFMSLARPIAQTTNAEKPVVNKRLLRSAFTPSIFLFIIPFSGLSRSPLQSLLARHRSLAPSEIHVSVLISFPALLFKSRRGLQIQI
ncbi:hypothetical protein ACLOJK_011456, partial [Asimina triloba]